MLAVLFLAVATTAPAQLFDYSVIGQSTMDYWNDSESGDFQIGTLATGIQVGQMADDGFDFEWAGTVLFPLSLTSVTEDDESTARLSDANFGAGMAGRFGVGYGISAIPGLVVTPGIAWHFIFNSYSFDFPAGATAYRELTHGPAAVGQAAFRLTDSFWLQGGLMLGYSPFYFAGFSASGSDQDMDYGTVTRGWLGVRLPFDLTGSIF